MNNKFNFDWAKISIYVSFIIAVLFYITRGLISGAKVAFVSIAVIFVIIGITIIIVRVFKQFLVSYSLYRTSVKNKRNELYLTDTNADYVSIRKALKYYKKTHLKVYRYLNLKYFVLLLFLTLIDLYILFLDISLIVKGW